MLFVDKNPSSELVDELIKDVDPVNDFMNKRVETIQENMPDELLTLCEKMNATFKPKLVVVWERES